MTALAAIPVVIIVGVLLRFGVAGWIGDASGGVLYTILIHLLLIALLPRLRAIPAGVLAFGVSSAVELAQLTTIPATLSEIWSPFRLILGTGFSPLDFPPYLLGALIAIALDLSFSARRRR